MRSVSSDPKLIPEELIRLVEKIRHAGIGPYNVSPDPLLYAFKSLTFTLTPQTDGKIAIWLIKKPTLADQFSGVSCVPPLRIGAISRGGLR